MILRCRSYNGNIRIIFAFYFNIYIYSPLKQQLSPSHEAVPSAVSVTSAKWFSLHQSHQMFLSLFVHSSLVCSFVCYIIVLSCCCTTVILYYVDILSYCHIIPVVLSYCQSSLSYRHIIVSLTYCCIIILSTYCHMAILPLYRHCIIVISSLLSYCCIVVIIIVFVLSSS